MCPPYPQRDRKRRLNGAVCRNHRIKRVVPCRCMDKHVKEPYEMSMAWEPDRRSNFFFSPPAHLCAVTYMTEISLIVTLNNQFNSSTQLNVMCIVTSLVRVKVLNATNRLVKRPEALGRKAMVRAFPFEFFAPPPPREDTGGLSREYVLRSPSVS